MRQHLASFLGVVLTEKTVRRKQNMTLQYSLLHADTLIILTGLILKLRLWSPANLNSLMHHVKRNMNVQLITSHSKYLFML